MKWLGDRKPDLSEMSAIFIQRTCYTTTNTSICPQSLTRPYSLTRLTVTTTFGNNRVALIIDAYSRKIVGWDLSRDLSSAGALRVLKMALRALPDGSSLIHHSDRGVQYCHSAYVKELDKRNILISMTESGDPLENATAERVNGILKNEWIDKRHLKSWHDAQFYVEKIIGLYNNQRPHQSISFLTPDLVHRSGISTDRKWKNYYPQKISQGEILPNLSFDAESQVITGNEAKSL